MPAMKAAVPSTRLWLGAALFLTTFFLSCDCAVMTITDKLDLITALRTINVDTIVLLSDLSLTGSEWKATTGFPITIGRDLLITGGTGTSTLLTFDLQYLTERIFIRQGFTVTINDLCVTNSKTKAGPSFEFAVLDTNADVRFNATVLRHLTCLPISIGLDNLNSLVRPIAGVQKVASLPNHCYNDTSGVPQCSSNVLYTTDFAYVPAIKASGNTSRTGFYIQLTEVYTLCDFTVDPNCLTQFPADFCVAQDLAKRLNGDPQTGGGGGGDNLTIILPAVLGGVALLLAIAGALFVWHRKTMSTPPSSVKDWVPYAGAALPGSSLPPASHRSTDPDAGRTLSLDQSGPRSSGRDAMGAGRASAPTSAEHPFSTERVEELRRLLVAGAARPDVLEQIVITERIGQGNFGKVYRGYWSGIPVAIKTLSFGGNSNTSDQQQRMALMEAAISCSVSHPNVVQTYTYSLASTNDGFGKIKPTNPAPADSMFSSAGFNNYLLPDNGPSQPSPSSVEMLDAPIAWEVRLVLEFCDQGSLREALDKGTLCGGGTRASVMGSTGSNTPAAGPPSDAQSAMSEDSVDFLGLLDLGLDVCRGMTHLHSKNIVHGDLKARNILLKSSAPSPAAANSGPASPDTSLGQSTAALAAGNSSMRLGVVAKVADFGLSLVIEPTATHISNVYQGTLTHMAPEVLIDGHLSKAADVYAFAILLWELLTGDHAFQGVPRALLAHRIGAEHARPPLPSHCPPVLAAMIQECWHRDPLKRPPFERVLKDMQVLRSTMSTRDDTEKVWKFAPRAASTRNEYETQPSTIFGDGMVVGANPASSFMIDKSGNNMSSGTFAPGHSPKPGPPAAARLPRVLEGAEPDVSKPADVHYPLDRDDSARPREPDTTDGSSNGLGSSTPGGSSGWSRPLLSGLPVPGNEAQQMPAPAHLSSINEHAPKSTFAELPPVAMPPVLTASLQRGVEEVMVQLSHGGHARVSSSNNLAGLEGAELSGRLSRHAQHDAADL